jgi:hypothetical protein
LQEIQNKTKVDKFLKWEVPKVNVSLATDILNSTVAEVKTNTTNSTHLYPKHDANTFMLSMPKGLRDLGNVTYSLA